MQYKISYDLMHTRKWEKIAASKVRMCPKKNLKIKDDFGFDLSLSPYLLNLANTYRSTIRVPLNEMDEVQNK